jgi:hypothetical protein
MPTKDEYTAISITYEMRDRAQALKRGGESWDTLLEKMAQQYDPKLPADER